MQSVFSLSLSSVASEAFPFDPLALFAWLSFCTLYLSYDFLLLYVNHLSTGEDRPILATCAAAKSRFRHFCSGWSVSFWEHELPLQTRNGKRLWRPKLAQRDHELAQTKCKRCKCSKHANVAILQGFPAFSTFLSIKFIQNASRTTKLRF